MDKELSYRQRQILDCIIRHTETHGYPPTVREIGEAVDLSSSSTVHAHLRALERMGLICRDAVLTRAIRVVTGTAETGRSQQITNIPIVGRVSAGKPQPALQNIEDFFPIPSDILGGEEGFMLRVKGDSMVEDGILEGDLVIVRPQKTAENGETVVAMVEDEATVKHFFRENNRIRLQPANSRMKPMYFDKVDIIGKVVGLVRRMQ